MKLPSVSSRALRLDGAIDASLPALLIATLCAVLIVVAAMRPLLSPDAILPALATLLFAAGAVAGAAALVRGRSGAMLDLAGLLTFLGIVAAALIEPEQMVRLLTPAPNAG